MRQAWRYFDDVYVVDTDVPVTYRDVLRTMMGFDDLYDELNVYIAEKVGTGADIVLHMMWSGAEHTRDRIVAGFLDWMTGDMRLVNGCLNRCAELVEEAEE